MAQPEQRTNDTPSSGVASATLRFIVIVALMVAATVSVWAVLEGDERNLWSDPVVATLLA